MSLRNRIERIEQQINRPRFGGGPMIIRIRGGLPDPEGVHARIGTLAILREPLETLDEFEARVIDTAIEMHAPFVVFDGLPPTADSEKTPTGPLPATFRLRGARKVR